MVYGAPFEKNVGAPWSSFVILLQAATHLAFPQPQPSRQHHQANLHSAQPLLASAIQPSLASATQTSLSDVHVIKSATRALSICCHSHCVSSLWLPKTTTVYQLWTSTCITALGLATPLHNHEWNFSTPPHCHHVALPTTTQHNTTPPSCYFHALFLTPFAPWLCNSHRNLPSLHCQPPFVAGLVISHCRRRRT